MLAACSGLSLLLLSGCGGVDEHPAEVSESVKVLRKPCVAGSFHRLGSTKLSYVAVVKSRAAVQRRAGGPLLASFGKRNVNGVPVLFSIRGAVVDAGCKPRRYLVQFAKRPNGATGWVAASSVDVETVRTRILVDLSDRRVTLYRNGRKVLSAAAAVGSPATPTPTGSFYVNQRLIPTEQGGPFGPGAVGISAFSEVLTGWTQGGPIAIHGTNAPWSIGKAVSNGCIRLRNPVLRRVFRQALGGTPVVIRA
jgi:lipoprotein-anchoring transpeptidase ErfK/SrfK